MITFKRFDAPKKRTCLKPDDLDAAGRRCGKRASKGKAEPAKTTAKPEAAKAEKTAKKPAQKCISASDKTASGRKCGKRSLEYKNPEAFKKLMGEKKPTEKPKESVKVADLPNNVKDATKKYGKPLASGAFGSVYVDGDRIVKVGKIGDNELKNLAKANELGIGPKILQVGELTPRKGKTHGVSVSDGSYAMEKVTGESPNNAVTAIERLNRLKANKSAIVNQIKTLHANGIAHNDFHSGNILIDSSGASSKVTIIDFGMSMSKDTDGDRYRKAAVTDVESLFYGLDFGTSEGYGKLKKLVKNMNKASDSEFEALLNDVYDNFLED